MSQRSTQSDRYAIDLQYNTFDVLDDDANSFTCEDEVADDDDNEIAVVRTVLDEDNNLFSCMSGIDTPVACSNGIDTGVSGLFMLNHPDLYTEQFQIDFPKTIRSASRNAGIEYAITGKYPNFFTNTVLTTKQSFPFLRLFFQRGSLQDSEDATIKWFYPYSYDSNGCSCEVWGTIVRDLSSGETLSHRVSGAIVKSLTISVNAAEYISIRSELIGRALETNHDSSGDTFTLTTESPLLWRNVASKIGDSYTALQTCDLKDFALSVKNDAKSRVFNSSAIQKFNLGRVTGLGSITIPWENTSTGWTNNTALDDMFSGELTRLSLYWGNQYVSTAYTMSINMLVRYMKGKISEDKEISNEMSFIIVEDNSFSSDNSYISSWSVDSSSADTINFTFPSTQTLTGNVFPGDVVLTLDASVGATTRWVVENVLDSNSVRLTTNHSAGVGASGTTVTIIRQPINIGLNDDIDRYIT